MNALAGSSHDIHILDSWKRIRLSEILVCITKNDMLLLLRSELKCRQRSRVTDFTLVATYYRFHQNGNQRLASDYLQLLCE
jgi:hypothetical protein